MEIKKVLEKILGFMKYFPEVTPEDFKKEIKNGDTSKTEGQSICLNVPVIF